MEQKEVAGVLHSEDQGKARAKKGWLGVYQALTNYAQRREDRTITDDAKGTDEKAAERGIKGQIEEDYAKEDMGCKQKF